MIARCRHKLETFSSRDKSYAQSGNGTWVSNPGLSTFAGALHNLKDANQQLHVCFGGRLHVNARLVD